MTSENQMLQIFQCGSDRQQPVCTICKWLMASINLILNHLIDESRVQTKVVDEQKWILLSHCIEWQCQTSRCWHWLWCHWCASHCFSELGISHPIFAPAHTALKIRPLAVSCLSLDDKEGCVQCTHCTMNSAHIVQCTVHTVYTVQWRKCVQCCTSFKKLTLSNHWLVVLSVSTSRWSRVDLHSIPYHLTRTSWSCSQIMFSSVNLGIVNSLYKWECLLCSEHTSIKLCFGEWLLSSLIDKRWREATNHQLAFFAWSACRPTGRQRARACQH